MSRFLIRSAGFSFDLVDLAADVVATQLDRRSRLRAEAERQARQWFEAASSTAEAPSRALRRARRAVARRRPLPDDAIALLDPEEVKAWHGCLADLEEVEKHLDDAVLRATERAGTKLRALLEDRRFNTALTISNPDLTERLRRSLHADPAGIHSSTRRNERVVYSYAQRFATKNETTGFFGPIDYGRFDQTTASHGDNVRLRYAGQPVCRHYARLSHWAVQAIADRIATDPDVSPHLRLQLRAGCAPGGERALLIAPTGRLVRLNPQQVEVIELVTTGRAIAGELAAHPATDELMSRGILTCRPLVPTALDDPAAWLRRTLDELRSAGVAAVAPWQDLLTTLARDSASLAGTDATHRQAVLAALESTFASTTGTPARRGAGDHYADRLLVTDDCRGGVSECVVPARQTEILVRRLSPPLLLCASYSTLVQEEVHARALAVHARVGGGRPVNFLHMVAELDNALSMSEVESSPAVVSWLNRLDSLVLPRAHDGTANIDPETLRPLLTEPPAGLVVSPDILLCGDPATEGLDRAEVVVGEVHHGAQVWSYLSVLDPDLSATEREVTALLSEGDGAAEPAMLLCRRTQGKAFEREVPGRIVPFRAAPARTEAEVTSAETLTVHRIDGTLRLMAPDGVPLRLHPRHPRSPSNWLFGLPPVVAPVPLRSAPRAPRIVVGDVVAWRRRWRLTAEQLRGLVAPREPGATVRAAADLRQQLELPRLIFARAHGARKPVFADLCCPTSLRNLAHYLREARAAELTEMLPEPRHWWLRPAGFAVSCEWRLTLGWRGSPPAPPEARPHA